MDAEVGVLAPVSDDRPTGENLELDPEFGALQRATQGKPEVQYGDTIEAAVPPEWREVIPLAEALLLRTHDLRVLVQLAIARLNVEGLPGFARVIASIRHELEERWPEVHPQLDPEDDNDPMVRANALLPLRDPGLVLKTLRDVVLAGNPRKLVISWRDIAVMTGAIEAEPGRTKLTETAVMGAFRDTDKQKLAANGVALRSLLTDVPAIPAAFDRHAGHGSGPNYEPLTKLLRDMQRDFARFESAVAESPADEEAAAGEGDDADGETAAAASAKPGRGFASITAIRNLARREDALHALELAAGYFRTQEPSSPLPLLIDRAKRLATMGFMDILRELAPEGVRQAEVVTGPQNK